MWQTTPNLSGLRRPCGLSGTVLLVLAGFPYVSVVGCWSAGGWTVWGALSRGAFSVLFTIFLPPASCSGLIGGGPRERAGAGPHIQPRTPSAICSWPPRLKASSASRAGEKGFTSLGEETPSHPQKEGGNKRMQILHPAPHSRRDQHPDRRLVGWGLLSLLPVNVVHSHQSLLNVVWSWEVGHSGF